MLASLPVLPADCLWNTNVDRPIPRTNGRMVESPKEAQTEPEQRSVSNLQHLAGQLQKLVAEAEHVEL